ncbi:TonB-dependent receptor [Sphingomonas sp. MMS24-J13]|uniref:TonB-dependent receptor n=1 Tax=Sphingomonas sp. MMS24-J13 TaxID=3238686 RepID=UPI00384DD1B3
MMTFKAAIARMLGGTALALAGSPALAQQAPQDGAANTPVAAAQPGSAAGVGGTNQPTEPSEIIVTAQKSSERLSKSPVAVSVVGQAALDRQNITAVANIITTVPNLQLSQNGFAIRGIGSNNSYSGYSTVATQIDGIYEPSSQVLALGLFDTSSIEVLRGPQGTVYGRNATAGVVNINTADPRNEFGVSGDVQYANFNELQTRAAVDLPVGGGLALRASFFRDVDRGINARYAADERFGKTDRLGARINGKWSLTDSLTWRFSLNYGQNRGTTPLIFLSSYNVYPNANLTTGTFGPATVIKTDQINPGMDLVTDNKMDLKYYAARSRLVWNVAEGLTATYLTGYSRIKDNGIDAATGVYSSQSIGTKTESYSNELDINFDRGPFALVAGAYAYRDKASSGATLIHAGNTAPYPFNQVFNAVGALVAGTGNQISTINGVDVVTTPIDNGSRSRALFGQGTYRVTDTLRLRAGVRATWDTVFARQYSNVCLGGTVTLANISTKSCPTFQLALTDDSQRPGKKFSKVNWKVGADYDLTPETMLYGTISTGYRSGGLQSSSNPEPFTSYKPETVTNYEAGVRSSLMHGVLFLSGTVFNMNYKDLQVSSIIPVPNQGPVAVTTNAAKARLRGVELEASFRPTSADRITGFVSFLDAKLRSFPNAQDNLHTPDTFYNIYAPSFGYATFGAATADFSGNRTPNSPKWSARAGYAHIFTLARGTITPSVDFYVQSKTYADAANYAQSLIGSYTKTDLNLRYDDAANRYYLDLFVNNVENDRVADNVVTVWSSTTTSYRRPRTYGVRAGFNFH